ncbi:MAG: S8 family serine peptidase [Solirubrobacterales bacterium]|nr:S8 family serine peptidase [Solirubrobacterales bacterium]
MRRVPAIGTALAAVAAVAVALVVLLAAGGRGPGAAQRSRAGHTDRLTPGHPRRLGALDHGRIGFALTLRLRERSLDAYLRHVVPASGAHPGLSASRFGARFGLSDFRMAHLRVLLRDMGIAIRGVYPQRTAMLVRAPVQRLRAIFGLRFGRYRTASGTSYFAAERAPHIPAELAPYITGLGDLSNAPVPSDDVPAAGLTPQIVARAYDIAPLWNRGFRGGGTTIAVASAFGAANPADLAAFAQQTGDPQPQVEVEKIDGGSEYTPQTGANPEVDLDLEVISSVAPDARIIDYQGSRLPSLGHSLADIYNRIDQDGQARIVSTSYGVCEAVLASQDPGDQQLIDNSLEALEASGVTVFVASGDSGAYGCLQVAQIAPGTNIPSGLDQLSVQTPASSPYAVSVGGTRLSVRRDGTYLAESAWSDPLERRGGGGGLSAVERRPPWQQGPGVQTAASNPEAHRQVPDVAGPADPGAGFFACMTGPDSSAPSCHGGNGGTSAAAPFWAGAMLLVEQYAARHGAGALAHCFAAPVLYDLAARHEPVPPFHHVPFGDNGYYPSGATWNYATGLGTPDVFDLAQDYAAFLHGRGHTCPF